MKAVLDYLTLPLSLPVNPILDYIITLLIGDIVYRIAFSYAKENARSGERYFVHWLVRIPLYFVIWLLVCLVILIVQFIRANWIWVLIILGIIAVSGIVTLIIIKVHKKNAAKSKK